MGGLNKTDGEILPGIGKGVVVPLEKWDIPSLNMLEMGAAAAYAEFRKLGAPADTKFTADNILVQEYHLLRKVVFIYWMVIKGEDCYYPYTFEIGDQVIQELAVTGKWPLLYAMPSAVKGRLH